MSETALVPQASQEIIDDAKSQSYKFMNPERWGIMQKMAETFITSGALPTTVKNAAQLIMVMQAGFEAGLQPIEALNAFYIVNGKISMYGEAVIAQVLKAGHMVDWGECSDTTATVKITRGDNGSSISQTFTMIQAEKRGLTKNPVYQRFPENMLRFKAFGVAARFLVPDALRGISIKEDIEGSFEAIQEIRNSKRPKVAKDQAVAVEHAPLADAIEATPEPEAKPEIKKPEAKGGFDDVMSMTDVSDKRKAEMLVEQELQGKKLSRIEQQFVTKNQ